ncbi:MAG: response regulator [Proteobacteria bacterium]|nr:response regulator [Pseudomonadota bacterium]
MTPTIIIVENNRTVLDTISQQVQSLGYRVVGALNSAEATATFLRERPIALAIIDVILSDTESGYALADSLVARDPALKVLLISGYSPEDQAKYRTYKNAYPTLQKPFRIREGRRLIQDIIESVNC